MKLLTQRSFKNLTLAAFVFVAIGVGSIVSGDSAFAATKTWTGANGGTFNTAGNWSPSGVPVTGDDLVFDNTTANNIVASNDISALSVGSVTFTGSKLVGFTNVGSNVLTVSGPITSTNTESATITGNVTLGADVTVTNVSLGTAAVALNGHALTFVTNASFPGGSTIAMGVMTGNGVVTIDARNTVSVFMDPTSTYTGTTNILSGVITTQSQDSNTIFGTSSIVVGPTASLTLDAAGATWSFPNPITIQPAVVGQSGYTEAQLYVWAGQPNQTISIPNITLLGNARFDLNDLAAAGTTVNLAGITANNFCIQYGGVNNAQAGVFLNGPVACVIGNEAEQVVGVPNTAAAFVKANPAIIVTLGVITAAVLAAIALRTRTAKK